MAQATEGVVGSGGLGLSNSGKGMMILKRVASVILDDSHEYFTGYQSLGTIFYKDPYDSSNLANGEFKINPINSARPITPNQQFYPLIGELVFLVSTMSNEPAGGDKQFKSRNYYFPPIRVHNQSSQNSQPSTFSIEDTTQTEKRDRAQSGTPNKASKPSEVIFNLGDFFEDRGVKRLLPYEGDYIIEGRFGNSIRFGATTPYDNETEKPYPNPWSFNSVGGKSTPDETEAQVGDPITIIRNGQTEVVSDNALVPLLEDINGDHSSIYLCSNQRLENFVVAGANERSKHQIKLDAYLTEKEEEAAEIESDNAWYNIAGNFLLDAALGAVGLGEIKGLAGPLGVLANLASGFVEGDYSTKEVPPAPILNVGESTTSQDDDTDDGLSFYNEMVGSGAVGADNFIEEIVEFENISVSGTELSPESYAENETATNTASGGGGGGGGGETGKKAPAPRENFNTYPSRIPCAKNDKFYTDVNPPVDGSTIAYNIINKANSNDPVFRKYKKSSRVKYLVIHTSAGNYGQTHLDVAYLFMQTKDGSGWTRVGYATTIDKEGMCCRMHGDGYYTNGVNYNGKKRENGKWVDQGITVPAGGIGNSANVVNIAWLGGHGTDVLTDGGDAITREQADSLQKIVKAYCDVYPDIRVIGHNQVHKKSCPRFYVPEFMNQIGGKYAKNGFEFPGQNSGATSEKYKKNAREVFKITGLQSGA